jgi:hypothetical protein
MMLAMRIMASVINDDTRPACILRGNLLRTLGNGRCARFFKLAAGIGGKSSSIGERVVSSGYQAIGRHPVTALISDP